jgi:hypothetical protein
LVDLGFFFIPVTSHTDPEGPQSWLECTGEYDGDGRLHIVWVEQVVANVSSDCRIQHWDDVSLTTRTIAEAIGFANIGYDGVRDLWLAYPQIGIGDGSTLCTDGPANPGSAGATSNRNYIYVTYEQYGGPTIDEGYDVSAVHFQQNLEIYLAVSNDAGLTWPPPVNLTNTQTSGCNGAQGGNDCASERDPSMALLVNDTIHIMYILDRDAGDAVFGEGSWTFNPVMYYRIPGGTDAEPICPDIAPQFAASLSLEFADCGYTANLNPPEVRNEVLAIRNLGNAALSGNVSISPPSATWLQLTTGAYAIAAGGPDDVRAVTMDPGDPSIPSEGLYQAQLEITHDDATKPSPVVIPVDFLVYDASTLVAGFEGTPTSGLLPVSVSFTSSPSIVADGFYWDFGDGDTSGEVNPVHTYTEAGQHDVMLRISRDAGVCVLRDSIAKIDYVDAFACSCPYQTDFDEDGFVTAVDLGWFVEILFRGIPEPHDPTCPLSRMDFDCNGFSDAVDLADLIDYLFAGGDPPCDPCVNL